MVELIQIYIVIAIALALIWASILYAIAPYLMGHESTLLASLRAQLLGTAPKSPWTVVQLTLGEAHFALASTLLILPPVVIDLQPAAGPVLIAESDQSFSGLTTTLTRDVL